MSFAASSSAPVKVLVVDDSILMQKLMTKIIDSAPGFQVIGVAGPRKRGGMRSRTCGPTSSRSTSSCRAGTGSSSWRGC